ncbi:MAG: DUF1573 domain-containing protein [Candidatus Ratteibacteria bacterium]|nr:DUF1573 domain-containing protein [Candidatus Ratteibacteria bacterium]
MKIKILVSLMALIIAVTAFSFFVLKNNSSRPAPMLKEGKIEFDEYVYDFGRAKEGEKIEHVFKLRNAGNEKLIIKKVNAPCGCTAATISDKDIPPGGEGEITVTFDTAGYKGFASKYIYVDSNAPSAKLEIQGILETELAVAPEYVDFGNLRQEIQRKKMIYITKAGDENIKILKTESSSDYLLVETQEVPQNPPNKYRKDFKIEIITAPNIPIGTLKETITIYTNDEKYPKIEMPIAGNIRASLEPGISESDLSIILFPPLFIFGSVKQGETPSNKINIKTMGEEPLKIEKIENPFEDFISITINPRIEGKEYEIVAFLKDSAPVGNMNGLIIIYTNISSQPRIEIPVSVSIKE